MGEVTKSIEVKVIGSDRHYQFRTHTKRTRKANDTQLGGLILCNWQHIENTINARESTVWLEKLTRQSDYESNYHFYFHMLTLPTSNK